MNTKTVTDLRVCLKLAYATLALPEETVIEHAPECTVPDKLALLSS